MFTGIITATGKIKSISPKDEIILFEIESPQIASKKEIGDSISIDGTCLTITNQNNETFAVQAIPETLNKTIMKNYKIGTIVNLENPLKINDELNGHLVQGHTDFIGKVRKILKDKNSKTFEISFPKENSKYFAMKGSVAINGISLTISKVNEESFKVSIIPKTLELTNLDSLKENDEVNIEIDLIMRYLETLLNQKEKQITYDFLKERGFI